MKILATLLLSFSALAMGGATETANPTVNGFAGIAKYDVVWDSPGERSANSMPLGNGDIGLNVWAEKNGDVLIYISKNDAYDNMNRLIKLGRIRLSVTPSPFKENQTFQQRLHLSEGKTTLTLGTGDTQVNLDIWVDANRPAIQIEAQSRQDFLLRSQLELWRKERELPPEEVHYLQADADKKFIEHPDTFAPSKEDELLWYYRNNDTPRPSLTNRTMGGLMRGANMKKSADNPRALVSAAPAKTQRLTIHALTAQTQSPEEWTRQIRALADAPYDPGKAWIEHKRYWKDFWNRSWIFIDGEKDPGFEVTQGYALTRFMLACAGRSSVPMRFNGSIFTYDVVGRAHKDIKEDYFFNADYRLWGSRFFWWQNTRWLYWPMLAAGDFDLMKPLFESYAGRHLENGIAMMKKSRKYEGAAVFHELSFFDGGNYRNNADWEVVTTYPTHDMAHSYYQILELASLMLDYADYTGDTSFLNQSALPIAAAGVGFFDQHFRNNPEKKFNLFPVGALETYSGTTDSMPELAGLHHVLDRLLATNVGTREQRMRWESLRGELPALPTRDFKGKPVLAPAKGDYGKPSNIENPELYAIFPFRCLGVGRPDLELARRSYAERRIKISRCWHHDAVDSAYIGDAGESAKNIVNQFTQGDPDSRFPAFWRKNNDWMPDLDNGGVGMTALQAMLLQPVGDKIYLMSAWPREWNVNCKLHAPDRTTVALNYRNGKVVSLDVSPPERKKDIILPEDLR